MNVDQLVARRRLDLLSTETTCYELVDHGNWSLQSLGICSWEQLTRHPHDRPDQIETVFRCETVQLLMGALHVSEPGPWLAIESTNRATEDLPPLADLLSDRTTDPGLPVDEAAPCMINGEPFTGMSNRHNTAARGVLSSGNTVTLFARRMPLPGDVTLQPVESFEPYLSGWQYYIAQLPAVH